MFSKERPPITAFVMVLCGFGALVLAGPGPISTNRPGTGGTDAGGDLAVAAKPGVRCPKIGVLLVSHGSRSAQWRGMLIDVHTAVEAGVLSHPCIDGVKSAFMEYNEPSIATQLRAFDEESFEEVVLVPLLLTVSSHSFDDIPTIYGAKESAHSRELLRVEGIERYTPRASVFMTPLLDYAGFLEQNIARRVTALSREPTEEGAVIVAYGSEPYDEEWRLTFDKIAARVSELTGISPVRYAWCGHVVRYSSKPTEEAIAGVLAERDRALVIPALVARDEMFQDRIIGGAVEQLGDSERIVYRPDSVLPDPALNKWIVSVAHETADTRRTTAEVGG